MSNKNTEQERALKENKRALKEKDNALQEARQEKDNALQEARQEKDTALKEKEKTLVINAYQSGLDVNTIKNITQLDIEIINAIIAAL